MSGRGAGDRHGQVPALRAGGDRPVRLRCINAALLDLKGRRIALVAMVVDAEMPQIVMFEGEPFLRLAGYHDGAPGYAQVRPYRADAMVIEFAELLTSCQRPGGDDASS
jgi:hypothetical protein